MFKPFFTVLTVIALSWQTPITAQQKHASYGPVVKAFLSGLDEEMTELEFMIRHREINRDDYERTKQRLTVRRQFVERTAARSREDRVPELQVLADDELGLLKPGGELNPDELQIGAQMGGRWKLVGIERIRIRFFVLEKLPQSEIGNIVPERKLKPEIDIRDVIETIVVRVESGEKSSPSPDAISAAPSPAESAAISGEPMRTVTSKPQPQNPRLLHIYLPEYTDKARERKVEGEIVVRALLQRDGKIKNIKIEKGLGYGLDDRAIAAVKRLGFLPAELDGREVDAAAQIVFNFKLDKVAVYIGAADLAKGARP